MLVPVAVVIGLLVGATGAHAAADPWTPTGPLADATRDHEALVALHDGSVLAIGGSNLSSVERYEPATGAWTAVAAMSVPRADAAAVVLADGRVLVAGGVNGGSFLASAERYDPATDMWTPAASMAEGRRFAPGQLLHDGSVLVAGGNIDFFGHYTAGAERYDPATDSWSSAGSLSTARGYGTLTLLPDGSALAAGGYGGALSANVDRYDPATSRWSPAASFPTPTYLHSAALLSDGRVLLAGGYSTYGRTTAAKVYDPQADRWTTIESMHGARSAAAAIRLSHGGVLLVGGTDDDRAELFDPASGHWLPAGHLGAIAGDSLGIALPDGGALVVGDVFGQTGAWRFSLATVAATAPLDFGEQTVRRLGPALPLAVRNDGDAPLYIDAVAIQGPDAADFSVVYDQCRQGAVAPGGSCLLGVRFTPSALGARAASLVVTGDVTGGSSSTALSGVGVAAAGQGTSAAAQSGAAGGGTRERGVRCSARRGRAVTCAGLPSRLATARGAVMLKRGGLTFARGTLRGGTLTLNVQRRLFHARYRLVVSRGTHVRAASVLIF